MVFEAWHFSLWRATYRKDNNTQNSIPINQNWEKSDVESLKTRPWVPFFSYCT